MKKISVIGVGRLGICFALLCEQAGYEVIGCDKREDYVNLLNRKGLATSEPNVEYLLQRSKNFTATTDLDKAISHSDLLFVFVATPSKENGEYDHSCIDEVVEGLLQHEWKGGLIIGKTIVICSTVMPMYCKSLSDKLSDHGVEVVYNPSFIAQGSICENLQNADIILIGANEDADLTDLMETHEAIMRVNSGFKILPHTAAEITKIGINCFLTMKISFANLIGEIAINSGEQQSIQKILGAIGSDSRIGTKYLNYGFGFEGVCLPRDNRALGIHAKLVCVSSLIPEMTDTFNSIHFNYLKQGYINSNPDKETVFVFSQLSYKKGVDILTESQHYRLCKELLDEGYKVIVAETDTIINMVKSDFEKYGDRVKYERMDNGTVSQYPERVMTAFNKMGLPFVI